MAIARLLACLPESDKLYKQKIKRMLLSLHHLNSTLFFESLPYLSSSDRRALKDAFGRSIPNYDRFEDQATNPRRYAKQNSEKVVVSSRITLIGCSTTAKTTSGIKKTSKASTAQSKRFGYQCAGDGESGAMDAWCAENVQCGVEGV
jgi:hypothetical protein